MKIIPAFAFVLLFALLMRYCFILCRQKFHWVYFDAHKRHYL